MRIVSGFFLILIATLLLVAGCTGHRNQAVDGSPKETLAGGPVENRDLACAYFYFLWGSHAEFDNRLEEALEAYEKALVCDPSADYISQKLPLLMMKMGDTEQARSLLEQAITKQPKDTARRLLLAAILIQQQQRGPAIAQYRAILSYEPDNGQALLRLGILLSQEKDYQQARQVLDLLLKLGQEPYLARLYLARVTEELGDHETAENFYRQALDANWSADLVYEIAEMFLTSNQSEKAIAILRTVLDEDQTDERARLGIVQALLALNREEEAIAELGLAKRYSSSPEKISIVLSRLYMRLEQQDKAVENLLAVINSNNSNEARYLLAVIYASQERFAESLDLLAHLKPEDEGYEDALFLRTKILHETGRTKEALQALESFIKDQSAIKPVMMLLAASLHRELGDNQRSLDLLAEAAARFPDDEQVLFEYGLQLEQNHRLGEAITVMERLIATNPEHAEALNFVGYCWADAGQHLDKALDYISRAMHLKPGNGYIQDSLGWVYFRLGNFPRAERELLAALRLLPDDPHINEHLGDLYAILDQLDKARSYYQHALDRFTDEEKKDTVRQKIKKIDSQ